MRNRAEAPLHNQTFSDPTASIGIRNADRKRVKVRSINPQTVRITELNQQLASLRMQKKEGLINRSEYGTRQQQLASKLQEEMIKAGHKSVRTKKKR